MSGVDEQAVRDIAKRAAQVLRERGWYQGWYAPRGEWVNRATCPVCALGALSVAVCGDPLAPLTREQGEVFSAAYDAVGRTAGIGRRGGISRWNDAPGRTADEVIAVLERVANGEGAP